MTVTALTKKKKEKKRKRKKVSCRKKLNFCLNFEQGYFKKRRLTPEWLLGEIDILDYRIVIFSHARLKLLVVMSKGTLY